MQRLIASALQTLAVLLLLTATTASIAQAPVGPRATRLLETTVRVKPEMAEKWLALQQNEVVPALKQTGIAHYTVYRTLVGDVSSFLTVRPLPSFGEFDGPDPLERALGARKAAALRAELDRCTQSIHRNIVNRQDEFFIDPGTAAALFVSRYRTATGRNQDYMNFIREYLFPPMQKAKANGTFAGLSITSSVQGGETGLITLNMHYDNFAPLDGPPPVAKTLSPDELRVFFAKGAGLLTTTEQAVLRRIPEASF